MKLISGGSVINGALFFCFCFTKLQKKIVGGPKIVLVGNSCFFLAVQTIFFGGVPRKNMKKKCC